MTEKNLAEAIWVLVPWLFGAVMVVVIIVGVIWWLFKGEYDYRKALRDNPGTDEGDSL